MGTEKEVLDDVVEGEESVEEEQESEEEAREDGRTDEEIAIDEHSATIDRVVGAGFDGNTLRSGRHNLAIRPLRR